MTGYNVLYLMSDQHQQKASGCYGHAFVKTPNIDALAARGTRFAAAYTNSPICVPARAVLATGRFVHETGYWDNVFAYDGRVKSWHHTLADHGLGVTSIGKLHYRNEQDPTGFAEQIIPLHIVDGVGDLRGCAKRPLAPPYTRWRGIERLGPGESTYTKYDADITQRTCDWLRSKAGQRGGAPWVLFSSLVCPHPPYSAPQDFYDLYPLNSMPTPKLINLDAPLHPWMQRLQRARNFDDFVDAPTRQRIMANYYGCVSYMDANLGRIIDCLEACGLRDNTIVVYTSDHGENLGTRRIWGKMNMYEESAAVPMVIAGPGIPEARCSNTAVTLADVAPTMLEAAGLGGLADAVGFPGRSLVALAQEPDDTDRLAFSEYHAAGADRAAFMIRKGRYKYIHYVGYEPELFDLDADPEELTSRHADPAHRATRDAYETLLREFVDPEDADARAYRDQSAMVEAHGGRAALIDKGSFQGTPAPGEKPVFIT